MSNALQILSFLACDGLWRRAWRIFQRLPSGRQGLARLKDFHGYLGSFFVHGVLTTKFRRETVGAVGKTLTIERLYATFYTSPGRGVRREGSGRSRRTSGRQISEYRRKSRADKLVWPRLAGSLRHDTGFADEATPICPLYFYVGIQIFDGQKFG